MTDVLLEPELARGQVIQDLRRVPSVLGYIVAVCHHGPWRPQRILCDGGMSRPVPFVTHWGWC